MNHFDVIPAQAGTQLIKSRRVASELFAAGWAPAFAGVTKGGVM